jgi:hypothetical protein
MFDFLNTFVRKIIQDENETNLITMRHMYGGCYRIGTGCGRPEAD